MPPVPTRKGVLSVEVPVATEGQAFVFRKVGGQPRVTFQVIPARWWHEGLPAARLLALLVILAFLARFRIFALPGLPSIVRGLAAVVALAALGALLISPIATCAAAVVCAIVWLFLRGRLRAAESRVY